MTYEVVGTPRKIDFGATCVAEVLQNVWMILTTPIFSVPLRRGWFMDYSLLDSPLPAAQAKLRTQILTAIRQNEPRARVLEITFIQPMVDSIDGRLIPRVLVEVNL